MFFLKRRNILSFGFRPKYPMIHRAWNIAVSLLILVFVLPVFAILILLVLIRSGRPVFYVGERIGKGGIPFNMFKFRTLETDVERKIGASVIAEDSGLITPLGKVLRDSRLDELPQLINVLRGDMNLIGPRPVRRVICEENMKKIKNYEVRFRVKPGLLGHTQVFVPHGTYKTIRARYNNVLVNRDTSLLGEAAFVIFAAIISMKLVSKRTLKTVKPAKSLTTVNEEENRNVDFALASANSGDSDTATTEPVTIEMINSKNLVIVSPSALHERLVSGNISVRKLKGGIVHVAIIAHVQNSMSVSANKQGSYCYHATYHTISDFGRYMVDRYVLHLAFAN